MDSGFRFSVSFRFRIPYFRAAWQQAGVPAQTTNSNEYELPKERKANESLNPTQTEQTDGWECRKQLCYKTEKINIWSQIYRVIYKKLYSTDSTVHMVIISGLADMISNTVSQYYRCANDWIPKKQNKGSTYHSRYQSFHQINFIWKHSSSSSSYTRWSDRFANLVSLQCWNWFYYVVVMHRNQKSSLWIFKSIDSFRLVINTKKYSWDGLSAYL